MPVTTTQMTTEKQTISGGLAIANELKSQKKPVIIYTPPPGISYKTRAGKWAMGHPVWNEETARRAMDEFTREAREYISGDPWLNGTFDMEKFFLLAESVESAVLLMKETKLK